MAEVGPSDLKVQRRKRSQQGGHPTFELETDVCMVPIATTRHLFPPQERVHGKRRASSPVKFSMNMSRNAKHMVPRAGFEPALMASEATVLPLDDLGKG